MNKADKIAVIGGDVRLLAAARKLSALGYRVSLCGFERCSERIDGMKAHHDIREATFGAGCIVLPLPYSLGGETVNAPFSEKEIPIARLMSLVTADTAVLGGCFDSGFTDKYSHSHTLYDYYECESLKTLNAIPTAEGAIAIAMEETTATIHGSKCTVISFGNVGETLARLLKAMNARVCVAARSAKARAKAESMGCDTVEMSELSKALRYSDIIFNAAPAEVLNEKTLSAVKRGALVIDLASRPGGVDFTAAKKLGVRVVWALSLPNRAAPVTAGEYLARTVNDIIRGAK